MEFIVAPTEVRISMRFQTKVYGAAGCMYKINSKQFGVTAQLFLCNIELLLAK